MSVHRKTGEARDDSALFREIEGLLALAGSSNEHESRAAAVKLVTRIGEYDLAIVKREEIQAAKTLHDEVESVKASLKDCVVLAKAEYHALIARVTTAESALAERKTARRKQLKREVVDGLADTAGGLVSSVMKGAIRRL